MHPLVQRFGFPAGGRISLLVAASSLLLACSSEEAFESLAKGAPVGKADHLAGASCFQSEPPEPFLQPTWHHAVPSNPKPTVHSAPMVFDSLRSRAVLYNGEDTWAWAGDTWELVATVPNAPRALRGYAMTYDSARDRIVLFGGKTNTFLLDETWEFDGTTWARVEPLASPTAREYHQMGYDVQRERVVLYGGGGPEFGFYDDLWEYDGQSWTQAAKGRQWPSERGFGDLIYAPSLGGLVLLNGRTSGSGLPRPDLLIWDGQAWQGKYNNAAPPYHSGLVVYDTVRETLVAYGGEEEVRHRGSLKHSEVFVLRDGTWQLDQTDVQAPAVTGHTGVYDSARERLVSFGGVPLTGWSGSLWELSLEPQPNRAPVLSLADGGSWTRTIWAGETLDMALLATDEDRHEVVFGASGLPDTANFDHDGHLTWTPQPEEAGEYVVEVGASDGELCDTRILTIQARFDEHSIMPQGTTSLGSYVYGPVTYVVRDRRGERRYTTRANAAVRVTGNNPGKLIVEVHLRVAVPENVIDWEHTASAVLEPSTETFEIQSQNRKLRIRGRIVADWRGDLSVELTEIRGRQIFGNDRFDGTLGPSYLYEE